MLFLVGTGTLLWLFPIWKSASAFDGHPIHWKAANSLILIRDSRLLRRQIDTGEVETLFDLLTVGDTSLEFIPEHTCFSDSKGLIPYYRRRENGIGLEGLLIYSLETGSISVEPSSSNLINFGPVCGDPYARRGKDDVSAPRVPNPDPDWEDIPGKAYQTLFKPSDAQNVLAGADFGSLSVVYEIGGEKKHIVLQGLRVPGSESLYNERWNGRWQDGDLPLSIRDRSSGKYLLHKTAGPTTKRVWVASLEKEEAEAIDLPIGPWAAENSSSIRCGACGCGCYRHQKFYFAGERIFILIWGTEYSKGVQGIYELVEGQDGPTWSQKVQGSLRIPLAFSPDGCRVAVFEEYGEVRRLCE